MTTSDGRNRMLVHIAVIAGLIGVLAASMLYPFMPGTYDNLAITISVMAQTFGVAGLLLVLIGGLWLAYEWWRQSRRRRNLTLKAGGYAFALLAIIASALVAIVLAIAAAASGSLVFGLLTLIVWAYVASRLRPPLKSLRQTERAYFSVVPIYLTIVPLAALILQLVIAAPATAFSRNHTIAMSAEIVTDIENYHAANGRYPTSLLAVYGDYAPSVVGVERYHYAPTREGYNLAFRQPRFVLDDFGVAEFVVYNPRDEHYMISHTSWILLLSPAQVNATQGWFAVRPAASPHWRSYLFD